jgi:hypothetical protein
MAIARLVAAIFVILSSALAAQQVPWVPLTIIVTEWHSDEVTLADRTGNHFEVSLTSGTTKIVGETDREGKAVLFLTPGKYLLSITNQEYVPWTETIIMQNLLDRTIHASMQIDCNDEGVVCDGPGYPDLASPSEEAYPQFPLPPGVSIPLPVPATPVFVYTAHNARAERDTKSQTEKLLAEHDLGQWSFTHAVIIDKQAAVHDHSALTLHTGYHHRDDELLSDYLQGQLMFFLTSRPENTQAAVLDLEHLYPTAAASDVKAPYASPYRRLLIGWLLQQAESAALGNERATEILSLQSGDHGWVDEAIAKDGGKIEAVLRENGLDNPDARISESGQ